MDFTKLKAGDKVSLNGIIFTARDNAHLFFLENDFPKIKNGIIYHCGPLIKNNKVISAGPTTSARMNQYTPDIVKRYGIKAIIGKGGMDEKVLNAIRGKAVYFSAVGGAGASYAKKMKVINVYKKEFGMPEAIWEIEVKDFPVVVAMDSKGNSLYDEIKEKSRKKLCGL
jgi:fumarate hydratase subunit beta